WASVRAPERLSRHSTNPAFHPRRARLAVHCLRALGPEGYVAVDLRWSRRLPRALPSVLPGDRPRRRRYSWLGIARTAGRLMALVRGIDTRITTRFSARTDLTAGR